MNVKELLARNRRDIWNLNDSNGTRTPNHLVLIQLINNLKAYVTCWQPFKCVRDMIIVYSQMHCTDTFSQHSSIIWIVFWRIWLNGWVFVYKLSCCGFESRCCHLKLLCFLTFGFFSECTFLRLQCVIWPSTYSINSSSSVVVYVYKKHVLMTHFPS